MTVAADPPDGPYNLAVELLEPNLERAPDATALRHAGRDISYAEVAERVWRVVGALRALDVRPEERVVTLLPDSPELVVTLLATLRVGAVAVPVNPALTGEALAYQIADARPGLVVAGAGELAELRAAPTAGTPAPRTVATWDGPPGDPDVVDLAALAAGCSPDPATAATSADDIALWLYSSGTTGRPKAVVHVHGAPVHSFRGFARGVLGIGAGDRTFSVPRLFSPSGLGNSLFFPFFAGGSSVLLTPPPAGGPLVEAVVDGRPSLLFGRPANYRQLMDEVPAEAMASLRLAVCSGERLDPRTRDRFGQRYGVEILEGTGSTEALHIYLCNRPGRARAGSSGEIVPGYQARLVDEDGRPVPDGEIGDLHIRGGSTLLCYWRNRAKTRQTLVGEWLVTGDKYRRDADGYFWHAGRSDDMWFDEGWVSPAEIEEVIEEHPAVREVAVTRVSAPDGGGVLACVVLTPDAQLADPAEELGALAEKRLDSRRRPRWVAVVDALPRTPSGKVQRHRLAELTGALG